MCKNAYFSIKSPKASRALLDTDSLLCLHDSTPLHRQLLASEAQPPWPNPGSAPVTPPPNRHPYPGSYLSETDSALQTIKYLPLSVTLPQMDGATLTAKCFALTQDELFLWRCRPFWGHFKISIVFTVLFSLNCCLYEEVQKYFNCQTFWQTV